MKAFLFLSVSLSLFCASVSAISAAEPQIACSAGEKDPVQSYVCTQQDLMREMEAIDQRYRQITKNTDQDIRRLAVWDRRFFLIALKNCTSAGVMEACARKRVLAKGQALSLPVSPPGMAVQIRANGILTAALVADYPQVFLNFTAVFPGTVRLSDDGAGHLSGSFTGAGEHTSYPAEMPGAGGKALAQFAAKPEASGWFRGRMERRGSSLTMELDGHSVTE